MSAPRKPCGTRAAHRRHRVAGEEPCDPCKAAQAGWNAQRDIQAPRRPCPGCGNLTRAAIKCPSCVERDEIALGNGDWVLRGGIKVWQPWPVAA
jgi:pyruvate/2-oxoacid:ferredoxin oxidoreductase beta subunit